jgi:hypothetical protein
MILRCPRGEEDAGEGSLGGQRRLLRYKGRRCGAGAPGGKIVGVSNVLFFGGEKRTEGGNDAFGFYWRGWATWNWGVGGDRSGLSCQVRRSTARLSRCLVSALIEFL